MSATIGVEHRNRPAYVYVRQSTLAQVRHNQERTERQYALRDKALALGWTPPTTSDTVPARVCGPPSNFQSHLPHQLDGVALAHHPGPHVVIEGNVAIRDLILEMD